MASCWVHRKVTMKVVMNRFCKHDLDRTRPAICDPTAAVLLLAAGSNDDDEISTKEKAIEERAAAIDKHARNKSRSKRFLTRRKNGKGKRRKQAMEQLDLSAPHDVPPDQDPNAKASFPQAAVPPAREIFSPGAVGSSFPMNTFDHHHLGGAGGFVRVVGRGGGGGGPSHKYLLLQWLRQSVSPTRPPLFSIFLMG